jgi:hypothetical protein
MLAAGEIGGPSALLPVIEGLDYGLRRRVEWLLPALAVPDAAEYVAGLARAATSQPVTATPASSTSFGSESVSQFAGLALLLPAIRSLGVAEQLGKEGLYQLLASLAGHDWGALAYGDAAPIWLSGLMPEQTLSARAAQIAWPAMTGEDEEDDYLGSGAKAALARAVLREFAGGLRGFEASSPAYIGQQFVRHAGVLRLVKGRIEVEMPRLPLGIVLRMAGRDGYQGLVPWLEGRELWLELQDA